MVSSSDEAREQQTSVAVEMPRMTRRVSVGAAR
jgi:hypothetical protein